MSFFDATSEVFKDFGEYFKVFIIEVLIGALLGLVSTMPLIGWLLGLLGVYYSLFIIPLGVYKIKRDERLEISELLENAYHFALHPGKASKNILKLIVILAGLIVCFICFITSLIFVLFAITMSETGILMFFGYLFVMVLICIGFSIVCQKVEMNLMYDITSILLGDEGLVFRKQNQEKFRYDFLWCFVPIVNLWAQYALLIKYINCYKQSND